VQGIFYFMTESCLQERENKIKKTNTAKR